MPYHQHPKLRKYPRNILSYLNDKYIIQNRIPLPTSLTGKDRWVVAKTIKFDVKRFRNFFQDDREHVQGYRQKDAVLCKLIATKLLALYMDACEVLNENGNERAEFYNILTGIINENKI
jgi:hypothetical protein